MQLCCNSLYNLDAITQFIFLTNIAFMDLILLSTLFSKNLLQTDLKTDLWFRRYHIFRIKSRKDSIHAYLLVGGLTYEVASRGWLCPFNFACTSVGLAEKCGVGPVGLRWRVDHRVREGLCTHCTKCNWPTTRVATGLPLKL